LALADRFGQAIAEAARDQVDGAARRLGQHEADRL
jgi:hypothetical protein